jgi:hypothetical protein
MAAVIAGRTVAPSRSRQADTYRPDAPSLPHHPFVLSCDVPFLPVAAFEAGGATLAPADLIDACFRHGRLRDSLLEPADPIHAALDLIASKTWDALILPDARRRASRMVRYQAVRAKGRTDLPARIESSLADDDQFDQWWRTSVLPTRTDR